MPVTLRFARPGRGQRYGPRKGVDMINSVRSLIPAGTPASDGAPDEKAGSWPGAATAAALAEAVESGRLNLPLPGGGRTRERWAVLADLAGEDLSLARLAEGHADALAILAAGSRWGVWAAQPPGPRLMANRTGGSWRLGGTKQYSPGRARSPTRW